MAEPIDSGMTEHVTVTGQAPTASGATGGAMGAAGAMLPVLGTMVSLYQTGQQREFERYMSGTAYQRAVADMRRAGLNPLMMYGKGFGGASTPSVAPGTAGETLARAPQSMMLAAQLKALAAQANASNAQAAKADQDRSFTELQTQIEAQKWLETGPDQLKGLSAEQQMKVNALSESEYDQKLFRSLDEMTEGKSLGEVNWKRILLYLAGQAARKF